MEIKVAILNKSNGPVRFEYDGNMFVLPSFKKTEKEFYENKIIMNADAKGKTKIIR